MSMWKRKRDTTPIATPAEPAAPPVVVKKAQPVTLEQAKAWAGIPADIYLNDDTIVMMGIEGRAQTLAPGEYEGTIENKGSSVSARINGRLVGDLTHKSLANAVQVLSATDGQSARVIVTVTERKTAYARARIL
jgi:hypothetical protein